MKKLTIFLLFTTLLLSGDLVLGFGYGSLTAKVDSGSDEYTTPNIRDMNYKAGWEFTDHSRVFITTNNPSMKDGEELSFNTLSWQAVDQTDPFIKGFFGIAVGQFTYKNENLAIEEYSVTPIGVELGLVFLEKGDWLKHMELEFGFRYFTTQFTGGSDDFKVKSFENSYVGFNFLF